MVKAAWLLHNINIVIWGGGGGGGGAVSLPSVYFICVDK